MRGFAVRICCSQNCLLRKVLFRYRLSRKTVAIFDRLKMDGRADENQIISPATQLYSIREGRAQSTCCTNLSPLKALCIARSERSHRCCCCGRIPYHRSPRWKFCLPDGTFQHREVRFQIAVFKPCTHYPRRRATRYYVMNSGL